MCLPYEPPWYIKFPALRRYKIIRTRINILKEHIYTHIIGFEFIPSLKSTLDLERDPYRHY